MSGINSLSEATEVASSMQIPVYDTGNGQPRKISVQQLQEFLEDNPSAPSAPVGLPSYSVAELTAAFAMANPQSIVYCTNGNSGAACLAVSNGASWLRVALGAAVSAT